MMRYGSWGWNYNDCLSHLACLFSFSFLFPPFYSIEILTRAYWAEMKHNRHGVRAKQEKDTPPTPAPYPTLIYIVFVALDDSIGRL